MDATGSLRTGVAPAASIDGAPVIEVDQLVTRYRGTVAVDGVSLTVVRGEICGLIGPDGAGKSSLIQVVAGMLRPAAGRVTLAGIDVVDHPAAVKARTGYMPQSAGTTLYDDLTVDEHLDFFAGLREVPAERFFEHRARLLEVTGLAGATHRLARHLSGGMRQKLGLACALIHMPDVLLLDEPTTGVDPLSRQSIWQVLARLWRDRRITVLLATPYLDEAERCHRVTLLDRGRLLGAGTPAALKATVGPDGRAMWMDEVFTILMGEHSPDRPGPRVATRRGAGRVAAASPPVVAEALTKRFGDVLAVKGVSFALREGEVFGLLGPNGAGKTTCMRMLTGIVPPSSGGGRVAGFDLLTQPQDIQAAIGYMSQRFSLYRDLTARENLGLYAQIYGLTGRRRRAREAAVVAATDLEQWLGKLARVLPAGIRQRLALACALLHEPRVLFLDEPTSGVDPLARRRFWNVIADLAVDRGVTVLVTTHNLDETAHCHRVGLVHHGELVAVGTPAELQEVAVGWRGAVIEIEAADFGRAVEALESWYPDLTLYGSRVHVFSRDPAVDRGRIERRLEETGLREATVGEVPMAMDDVFATLVERGA